MRTSPTSAVVRARFCARADPRASTLELTVLLIAAFLLARALGPAHHGLPDSATYLSAAQHLAQGDGYVISALDEQGQFEAVSCFAPLFSLLLAAEMKLTGVTALAALPHLLVASFVLYALACRILLRVLLPAGLRRWSSLFTLALVCAPGSLTCLRGALSDLLGAALALFACADCCARAQSGPWAWRRDGLASLRSGALFALALWTRWSNLYFLLGASLGWLVCVPAQPLGSRLKRALIPLASVALFVGPLWLRNVLATDTPMGPRPPQLSAPLVHVQRALHGIAGPLFEPVANLPVLSLLYLLLVCACAAGVLALWLKRRDPRTDVGLILGFGYASLLILSSSTTQFDSLDHPRFWLSLLPLWFALSLRALVAMPRSPFRPLLLASSVLVLSLATLRTGLTLVQELRHTPAPSGLFASRFASSPAVHSALALADRGRCALAAPHAFWLYPQIGTRPISWLTETDKGALGSQPGCVLLLRERADYNTDRALFAARLRELSRASRAHLLQRDALAELWWTAAL